jgi:hypothetical protein
MSFRKGLIIAKLHSYGLLDSETTTATTTEVAVAAVSKKKAILARRLLCRQVRQPKHQEHRRNDIWMDHLEKGREKDGFFVERYHTTEEYFDKLVDLLDLPLNEAKSHNSTQGVDPIIKPMVVGIRLRFLGGESHKSLEDAFHISKSPSERAVRRFATAVVQCEALRIKLPKEEELEELKTKWSEMSTAPSKLLHGCILALDGFLSARVKPNVEDDAHYHSIHNKIHRLNIQAAIDYLLRFRYVWLCCCPWKNK